MASHLYDRNLLSGYKLLLTNEIAANLSDVT